MNPLVITLAQINPTVGALEHNADLVLDAAKRAAAEGSDVVVFPELVLSGYPPEDLVLKRHFLEDVERQLVRIAASAPPGLVLLVGAPVAHAGQVYNAAVVVQDGATALRYHKMSLPNYGVFDEKRVFAEGTTPLVITVKGSRLALHICEDSWSTDFASTRALADHQADLLINLSASPYHMGKLEMREEILGRTARFLGIPLLYCNLVGGQDELVFDGGSFVLDGGGHIVAKAKLFEDDLLHVSFPIIGQSPAPVVQSLDSEEIYAALRLGLKDYVDKNGFGRALIAISGGIDSALVAALAVDALGADRVIGVTLPSRFSSTGTLGDARELGRRLGIEFYDVPIKRIHDVFLDEITPLWPGKLPDTTEENLQARIRGTIVMALSNKFGWLVLTTGNKSEMATGYCTLYGDMAGGLAVIKDVPKTLVFELSRWRNAHTPDAPPIPESIITRPPSAELRDNQKDEDSLPPYGVLDPIIERYVERDQSAAAIIADGFDPAVVARVIKLIDGNEYKRRQGPPGIKITPKAFGRDRRLPITNHYSEQVKARRHQPTGGPMEKRP
jgi:NAD+ synthase (glutamine-hydrolysing)